MSFLAEEIRAQPSAWRRAAALARREEATLPRRGARIAVVGCGTSWFVAQAERALADDPDPVALEAGQLTFLGRGFAAGPAQEAALKLREATQSWTEAYPAMEYRHGPIAIASRGRAVWSLGTLPRGLADEIAATGAELIHREGEDPQATLVRVHRVAEALAARRGLDPDHPRHLGRSMTLEP